MRPVPVVLVSPARESFGSLLRVLEDVRVGPFADRGLDEAFGLAVGARSVGPGAAMLQTERVAGAMEAAREIAGAVVGE